MKPRVLKGLQINSTLSYQRFRQKGYYILPNLAMKFKDTSRCAESLNSKTVRKIMLVKIFKRVKFIRNADLSSFLVADQNFYSSKSRYIAKRLSNTLLLSLYDYRELKNEYKGVVTSWPKYMKRLQSFDYQIEFQNQKPNSFALALPPLNRNRQKLPDRIGLVTDYLRYVRGLKAIKVTFPYGEFASYMNGIWRFKKYPSLIEKLSLSQATNAKDTLKVSFEHFKKLKALDIYFVWNTPISFMKSIISLTSHLSQLEVLTINFVEIFEIGPEICTAFKKLVNLKKVKLRLSVEKYPKNLQILEALEDCPLKAFSLKVLMQDERDIGLITKFLKKKTNSLEHLKIYITKSTLLESSNQLVELINSIDNLSKLTNLTLSHKVSFVVKTARETILPELDLSLKNLFSKPILLKRFKIALNQFRFTHEGLMNILDSVKRNAQTIEKISIDIAKYNIKTKTEIGSMIGFISSLTNIRSLKLYGMGVPTRQFFSELVDVVSTLRFLRVFYIGEVSAKVTQATFVEGVEKVLLKPGIEKFICETSADFKKALAKKTKASPDDIDLENIKKKNPFLKERPYAPIYSPEARDEMWKV